jgi:DNA-binding CsgD family transcriptional regulator
MNPAMINTNTEFFTWQGEVMVIHGRTVYNFNDAPLSAIDLLADALENDKRAHDGLTLMGIHEPVERLRKYAACRYGALNDNADFGTSAKDDEMINCQNKHICKGYGLVCRKKFSVHGEKLSAREVEVGCEVAKGFTVEQIATSMFVAPITIHSTLLHIKQKLNLPSRAAVSSFFTRNMMNTL